jgi:hypothetical protein
MKRFGVLVVAAVLSSVAGALPAVAQPGPIHVKTVDILTHGDLTGLAYDGTRYYLAMHNVRCWRWKCGRRCDEIVCHGGVDVCLADGTYEKYLEDGRDYGRFWRHTSGVAVKGARAWSMSEDWQNGMQLRAHNTTTDSMVQWMPLPDPFWWDGLGRLAHDGRILWGTPSGGGAVYRLDPKRNAWDGSMVTGMVPIEPMGDCQLRDLAPDGLGGMWFGGVSGACRGQLLRYRLAETAPGVLEATLVESYGGFGDFLAFTTNTGNPLELVLVKPHPTRAFAFVAEHFLMPPYEPPNHLASLIPSSTTVSGCLDTSATVRLTGPAPVVGGVKVALLSDNPNVVVPAALTFESGEETKRFPIVTSPVTNQETATITATIPGHSLSATLTLEPMGPRAVSFAPNPVMGGSRVRGTLVLECPAGPGDVSVTLTSTTPDVAAVVGSAVTVPAGATVLPLEVATAPVTRKTSVLISATANGVTKSKTLVVTPAP